MLGDDRRRLLILTGALVPVLVAWNNVVVPWVPAGTGPYVALNGAATVVLLAIARWCGLCWAELGLGRRWLRSGARWGFGAAGVVAAGYAAALALPGLRPLLLDGRVAGTPAAELAAAALVRIPLGTVVWEEVAFRGVLLAALVRLTSWRAGTVIAAAVFGVWHVRPTLSALAANDLVDGHLARAGAVLLACLATAAAGLLLAELRRRSGSLLAPVLLHLATNSLGLLAAAAAHRVH